MSGSGGQTDRQIGTWSLEEEGRPLPPCADGKRERREGKSSPSAQGGRGSPSARLRQWLSVRTWLSVCTRRLSACASDAVALRQAVALRLRKEAALRLLAPTESGGRERQGQGLHLPCCGSPARLYRATVALLVTPLPAGHAGRAHASAPSLLPSLQPERGGKEKTNENGNIF